MLAGVSHDLRTPLTRLRLALAMLPAREELHDEVADMTHDVEDMERMIAGYLSFARGEGAGAGARGRCGAAVAGCGGGGAADRGFDPRSMRRPQLYRAAAPGCDPPGGDQSGG